MNSVRRLARGLVLTLWLILPVVAMAQDPGLAPGISGTPGISPTTFASGFAGRSDWVIDDMMRPFRDAQMSMTPVNSGGISNNLGQRLGLHERYLTTGIGGQYLSTILGADVLGRSVSWFGGGVNDAGVANPVIKEMLNFGALLGVLFTSLFLIVHAVVSFFNKMEYGDFLGQTKDRFIGGFRAILAFGLIMPVSASGIAGATHTVAFVAAASNGMGNKAAEVVINGGFGATNSITSFAFDHSYQPDAISNVFAQSVAQDTCRQYMLSMGANAPEIARACGSYLGGGNGDLTVGYDPSAAQGQSDQQYCETVVGGSFFVDDRYQVTACMRVVSAQRTARDRAREILERYEGDLENPDALRELQQVSRELHQSAKEEITQINESAFGSLNGSSNTVHNKMSSFVAMGGWPVLGVIYSEIGAQIDAVSNLQNASNDGGGFSLAGLEDAGSAAASARRQIQRNQALAQLGDGAAQYDASVGSPNWFMSFMHTIGRAGDWWGDVTDGLEDIGRSAMVWLFSPMFEEPGPVATHKIGSNILGGAMAFIVGYDLARLVPGVRQATTGVKKFFEYVAKMGGLDDNSKWHDGSMIVKVLVLYVSLLIMLMLLVATFLVVVLPKLPIFFVSFLALEWAIWCAILIFASPLWVALNLTAVSNQPGLFTQRALSGLSVLAYLALFPTLVVMAVVVSLIAYNLIIPILGLSLLMSFGGGGIGSLIGFMTMPFIVLLALSLGGFVAVSAIMKVPGMITGFLGIQAPGDGVSQQASTFVASPMQYSSVTSPQSIVNQGGRALMGATKA